MPTPMNMGELIYNIRVTLITGAAGITFENPKYYANLRYFVFVVVAQRWSKPGKISDRFVGVVPVRHCPIVGSTREDVLAL